MFRFAFKNSLSNEKTLDTLVDVIVVHYNDKNIQVLPKVFDIKSQCFKVMPIFVPK